MKYCILCLVFILQSLSSLTNLQAQEAERVEAFQKIHIGLYAGANLSTGIITKSPFLLSSGISTTLIPGVGFDVGGIGRYSITQSIFMELAPGYSRKTFGSEVHGIVFGSDIDPNLGIVSTSIIILSISMDELHVPLYVRWQFLNQRVSIFSGGEYHFMFSTKSVQSTQLGNGQTTQLETMLPKSNNASIPIGIGVNFPLKNAMNLGMDFKANYYYIPMKYPLISMNFIFLHFSSRFIF